MLCRVRVSVNTAVPERVGGRLEMQRGPRGNGSARPAGAPPILCTGSINEFPNFRPKRRDRYRADGASSGRGRREHDSARLAPSARTTTAGEQRAEVAEGRLSRLQNGCRADFSAL
eukprot:3434632-Prymnesium_polylepis.1